ncbi:MAG: hypothetical protein JXR16_02020 [Bermanella sp.]
MFAIQECVTTLKNLAKNNESEDLTHCQKLDLQSQKLGFNNFHDFRKSLSHLPTDRFGKISLKLMRKYCESAKPSLDTAYYEIYADIGPKIGFYSHWIGYDKIGREVREPRPLNGKKSINGLRKLFHSPVYVVEDNKQLLSWLHNWYGTALVPDKLAKEYFPEKFNRRRLVCKDVDIKLVRACNENYDNNIAT